MGVTYLDPAGSQIGKKESIADTARVLGRMFDGIEYRGYAQEYRGGARALCGCPGVERTDQRVPPDADSGGFSDDSRALRLTDAAVKLVYMGDARYNMGNSLMVGCAKMGMQFTACAPQAYFPDRALVEQCQHDCRPKPAPTLTFSEDPAAVAGADVVYTDVWVSMGEPAEVWAERIRDLAPYQVNAALMERAGEQAVFMHCLPAFHDLRTAVGAEMGHAFGREAMEVTDEVFESERSHGVR